MDALGEQQRQRWRRRQAEVLEFGRETRDTRPAEPAQQLAQAMRQQEAAGGETQHQQPSRCRACMRDGSGVGDHRAGRQCPPSDAPNMLLAYWMPRP